MIQEGWRGTLRVGLLGFCLLVTMAGRGAERIIAYAVDAGSVGNQDFSGSLGMDFEVVNPILVTRLGVFDDGSDGLQRDLVAYLYDRSDPTAPVLLATLTFTSDDPGDLVGGSRFKDLQEPVRLEAGFQGTIVAENYGEGETLRNAGGNPALRAWTLNDGNGSIRFVGASRYGTQGEYPFTDDGGPADRYAAGTFEYETTPPQKPGTPGGLALIAGDGQITLTWLAVTNPFPPPRTESCAPMPATAHLPRSQKPPN